jgi:phosphoribosylformimino-5-aminoimidazole carboxamide ribotide isomerase
VKALFAMDLIGNKTVRLKKGDFAQMTVYSDDPLQKISEMVAQGARDFHIIDLDGAREGSPRHAPLITAMREKIPGYMEVGGGIRTLDVIKEYSAWGIDGVIVGTAALESSVFFESLSGFRNIVLGLDLLDGQAMARGWKSAAGRPVEEILLDAERIGVLAVLLTSIAKDGMLAGPDYEGLQSVMAVTDLPLIASGGVTSIEDVKRLKAMGVWATILGKAVYEGLIDVEEAARYAD